MNSYSIKSYGLTHVGKIKSENEDSFRVDKAKSFFAVADGMSLHANGEVASRTAVRNALVTFDPHRPDSIKASLMHAHEKLMKINEKARSSRDKMTTTLTLLHLNTHGHGWIAHAGDSRVYLLRNNRLEQLTIDHVVPKGFWGAGKITQAVGYHDGLEPQERKVKVKPKDVFFMCSDGITKHVKRSQLKQALRMVRDGEAVTAEAARMLVDLANRKGGSDNITAVVVHAKPKARHK